MTAPLFTIQNPAKKLTKKQVSYRDRAFLFYTCGGMGRVPQCAYFVPPQQASADACSPATCNKVIEPIQKCGYCMLWSYMKRQSVRELVLGKRPG